MNKLIKFLLLLLISGATSLFIISCEDYEEKLTGSNPAGSAVDVSNRITGVSPDVAGAGASFTVQGNNLSGVIRVLIGDLWITDFEASESSVTLNVPANVTIGENELVLVFSGSGRATRTIEVIPLPAISYFTPKAVDEGDVVTILGTNLSYVSSLSIGGVNATVTSKENNKLTFTVPGGISSAPIQLTSTSGSVTSSSGSIISCSAEPGNFACMPVINTNGSFEDSPLGAADAVSGWGGWNGSLASGLITDEEAYDGFKSVKITINELGPNPWSIQPTSTMAVDPDATYHVSFWIKGSGLTNAKFAMDQGGTPGWSEWAAPEMAVPSQWTEVTYEFSPTTEAAPTGDQSTRFAISMNYTGNVGGVMYLDNLRVVKKP